MRERIPSWLQTITFATEVKTIPPVHACDANKSERPKRGDDRELIPGINPGLKLTD